MLQQLLQPVKLVAVAQRRCQMTLRHLTALSYQGDLLLLEHVLQQQELPVVAGDYKLCQPMALAPVVLEDGFEADLVGGFAEPVLESSQQSSN